MHFKFLLKVFIDTLSELETENKTETGTKIRSLLTPHLCKIYGLLSSPELVLYRHLFNISLFLQKRLEQNFHGAF